MKLKGAKRRSTFIKEVEPTKHKYDAVMTWSANTDTYKPTIDGHGWDFEINAFKHNLKGTILLNYQTDSMYETMIKEALKTGVLGGGAYFRAAEELQPQIDWLKNVFGKLPGYLSYAYGQRDHDEWVLQNTLVSRLSRDTEVGYDFNDRLGHSVSSLFNYNVRDIDTQTAVSNSTKQLQRAINNKGWYNDFSHWHWAEFYGDKNQWSQLMTKHKELLNNVNYVSLSASEAVEYMWLRKQFKRGGLYQKENEIALICETDNKEKLPYNAIKTSLSVKVDTTGTILEDKEVSCNTEIFKIDTNEYIVQVPYSKYDGFRVVYLEATQTPDYLNFNLPKITNATLTGQNLSIYTDVYTKIAVFTTPKDNELYTATLVTRDNNLSKSRTLNIGDTNNKDVYIGVIGKNKQSILSRL